IFWTIFSQLFMTIFKKNILIMVIAVGTFSLALAFAGNDLVNFIGVPMAAYQSYMDWSASGVAASEYSMHSLAEKVPAEPMLLFIAGGVMVLTLWFSKEARTVFDTDIDLARQGEGHEKFNHNMLSSFLVKSSTHVSTCFNYIIPASL